MGANGGVPGVNGRTTKSTKSVGANYGLIDTSTKGFSNSLEVQEAAKSRNYLTDYVNQQKALGLAAEAEKQQIRELNRRLDGYLNNPNNKYKPFGSVPVDPVIVEELGNGKSQWTQRTDQRPPLPELQPKSVAAKTTVTPGDYAFESATTERVLRGGGTPSSSIGGRGGLGGSSVSSTTGNSPGGIIKPSGGVNAIAGTAGKVAGTALKAAGAIGTGLQLVDAVKNTYNDGKNWIDRNNSDPLVKAKAWKDFYEKSTWINAVPPFNKWQADRNAKFKANLRLNDPATYKALYVETAGNYMISPAVYPYTGGTIPGQGYYAYLDLLVQLTPSVAQAYYGVSIITDGIVGPVTAINITKVPSDNRRIDWGVNAYWKQNAWSAPTPFVFTKVYYHGWSNSQIVDAKIRLLPTSGAVNPDDLPAPTTPAVIGIAGGIGVGSSVLNAGGYLKLKGSPNGTSVSLDGTSAPEPRNIAVEDFGSGTFGTPKIFLPGGVAKDYTPPPIDANGKYAPQVKSTSGASSTSGTQYLPSSNLGDFGGGEIWYDKDGNVVSKEAAAASRAGIGFDSDRTLTFVTDANGNTRLGVDPSGSTAKSPPSSSPSTTQPSGTTGTDVPKAEAPGAQPTPVPVTVTPPSTTPEATPKFDLTKTMIDEIAIAVISIPAFIALKDFASKAFQNTEAIKNTPKSPCLAPVYVPPVGADVKKNLIATNTLQGVTIAQGQATQNAVNAVSTTVSTVNAKLGEQLVGGISGTLGRLFNSLGLDRWLNLINTALLIHNATMLSNNVLQTVGSVVDNILQLTGFQFKNAEGNQVSFGELVGLEFHQLLNTVLGAQNATALLENLKKANRIYQAAANVLWSVQSLLDSARSLTEIAIENTGKIGNALRKAGAVLENAYRPMVEKVTASSASQQKFDNIVNNLDDVERVFSTFEQITSEGVSIKDNLQQIKTDKKEFDDSIKAYKDDEKAKEDASKTTSSTVDITKLHLVKPEETTP